MKNLDPKQYDDESAYEDENERYQGTDEDVDELELDDEEELLPLEDEQDEFLQGMERGRENVDDDDEDESY